MRTITLRHHLLTQTYVLPCHAPTQAPQCLRYTGADVLMVSSRLLCAECDLVSCSPGGTDWCPRDPGGAAHWPTVGISSCSPTASSSGGSCEAEHFVEIDVESDEDGRVALKRRSKEQVWADHIWSWGSPHLRSPKRVDPLISFRFTLVYMFIWGIVEDSWGCWGTIIDP